jgi:nicotinamidase-related amidase
MTKRIIPQQCCGVIIDVQEFFLSLVHKRLQSRLTKNLRNFVRLAGYFQIPMIVTLERPVDHKGTLPPEVRRQLGDRTETFEKSYWDLSKEKKIASHLARLKKKQILVTGCETDVCVLQSCLGLLDLGYEVFVVEELIFSSSTNVEAAIARMKAEGAVFVSYKTLFYELIESVEDDRQTSKNLEKFGPFPDDIPDMAV